MRGAGVEATLTLYADHSASVSEAWFNDPSDLRIHGRQFVQGGPKCQTPALALCAAFARAKAMTPERRAEIAKKAAAKRWEK